MSIVVDGNNFFHTGWIARFLNLPRNHPSASALKTGDLAAFYDGWDMCDDTPETGNPNRLTAFYGMSRMEQASVTWVSDA